MAFSPDVSGGPKQQQAAAGEYKKLDTEKVDITIALKMLKRREKKKRKREKGREEK